MVYPVDEAAERAAKGQEYLSLYDVLMSDIDLVVALAGEICYFERSAVP